MFQMDSVDLHRAKLLNYKNILQNIITVLILYNLHNIF